MLRFHDVSVENAITFDMACTRTGAFVVDERQRIVFWNEGAQRLLGYAADEMVGRCYCVVLGTPVHSCVACPATNIAAQLLDDGVVWHVIAAVTRDGARKRVRFTTMLGQTPQGALRILHFIRDLTPQLDGVLPSPGATALGERQEANACGVSREEPLRASALPSSARVDKITPTWTELTKRELEVLRTLAGGLSNQELADTLGISPITARNHIANIIDKLGVKSRLQAVLVATHWGLI